jgi:hypothetical protein
LKLFLDTTIQIDKWAATEERKDNIESILNNSTNNITSDYVLGEYKRTICNGVKLFLKLLKGSPSVGEAERRLAEYSSYSSTLQRTIKLLLGPFQHELETKTPSLTLGELKERVMKYFESLLDFQLDDFFWLYISEDEFIPSPRCAYATHPPTASRNILCPAQSSPPCDIETFWLNHQQELQTMANNLPENRKNLRKLKSLINRIVKDETHVHGTNCFKLGDTIISIQTPEDYHIFTTNVQDFEPICKALGKPAPIVP